MDRTGFAGIAAAILLVMRFYLAVVFLRAGTVKLADRREFRSAVANYEILPAGLVGAAAVTVPAVEVAAGTLLLLGVLPGVVAAVLAALLLAFAAGIAVNLARGRVFDCGCDTGSAAPQTISWGHVTVDALLAAGAVALCLAPPRDLALLPGPGGAFAVGVPGGSTLPVLLAAALVFLVARVLGQAAAARRQLRDG